MDTQRLVVFFIFTFSLLLLWDAWQRQQPSSPKEIASPQAQPTPSRPLSPVAPSAPVTAASYVSGEKIKVRTDLVSAEINTLGGDLQYLELLDHRHALDKNKNLVLFSPAEPNRYLAQTGLIGPALPTHVANFRAASLSYILASEQARLEVPLIWEDANLRVTKTYIFTRGSHVLDVVYTVENRSAAPVAPDVYYQLVRDGKPPPGDSSLIPTYTGAAIYTAEHKFKKLSFSDIGDGKAGTQANNGWVAMLQHYFVSAWLPKAGGEREFYSKELKDGTYAAGVILLQPLGKIAPGETKQLRVALYAGPQVQSQLAELAPGLDLTVDYGWLTILAAPLFWVLAFIYKGVGNWGLAIILLTVLIKILFYPLSAKSYHSMAQMRVLAPKLQRIKEQHGEDRQKLQSAMMDLYKNEKINPLGGCLPILVQIPVFIALYWVLLASVEMRHAPFILWIKDLSAPDPYYILPIVMGLTMIIQTKLNPTPPDPIQAKVMMIMPLVFSVFFFFFPAGLVLYWVVNNVLSIAQQWLINRSLERSVAAKGHGKP